MQISYHVTAVSAYSGLEQCEETDKWTRMDVICKYFLLMIRRQT
jgi:hypothetical protein